MPRHKLTEEEKQRGLANSLAVRQWRKLIRHLTRDRLRMVEAVSGHPPTEAEIQFVLDALVLTHPRPTTSGRGRHAPPKPLDVEIADPTGPQRRPLLFSLRSDPPRKPRTNHPMLEALSAANEAAWAAERARTARKFAGRASRPAEDDPTGGRISVDFPQVVTFRPDGKRGM